MIGDLLQKADEFDKDADDVTSAWAGNLDQAGWGVADGPMSSFSAKGKTGNDLPNKNELNGRSGAGRRGKSTGQMVGDTSRTLPGRPTPARLDNSKFEPGNAQEGERRGPQRRDRRRQEGRRRPDRSARRRAAGLRERHGPSQREAGRRPRESGESGPEARHDGRVVVAAVGEHRADEVDRERPGGRPIRGRRPQAARGDGQAAFGLQRRGPCHGGGGRSGADLPPQLRGELLQSSEEAYPPGYEGLLKSYYKSLSAGDK